jgi:putative membrane protein
MFVAQRNRKSVDQPKPSMPSQPAEASQGVAPAADVPDSGRMTRSRTGTAWLGICTAVAALVVLLVFMLQNTRSVGVTFLWMHGSVPLALALLTAGLGAAVVALVFGQARIGQLRRVARRHR